MRAVEKYYSVVECALLLSCSRKTIIRKADAGEFGEDVVNLGSDDKGKDYRIPASGLNAYLSSRRVVPEPGIFARSVGELRRKVQTSEPHEED